MVQTWILLCLAPIPHHRRNSLGDVRSYQRSFAALDLDPENIHSLLQNLLQNLLQKALFLYWRVALIVNGIARQVCVTNHDPCCAVSQQRS